MRVEAVILEDHRDVALAWSEMRDVALVDSYRTRGDFFEAGNHAEDRRLARARASDEDQQLTIGNGEIKVFDDRRRAEGLADMIERD
jgi:hypothetical protein